MDAATCGQMRFDALVSNGGGRFFYPETTDWTDQPRPDGVDENLSTRASRTAAIVSSLPKPAILVTANLAEA